MIRTVIQPPHTPRDLNVPEIDSQPEGESQQLEISPINPLISAEASSSIIQSIDLRITRVMVCGCFCPCSCHRKRYFKSPTFLNQVLGSLFVGYNALPFLTTPCDSPQCRRNALSTTSLYYTFPHWFLDRIVAMKSRHPGPDLQLKVLRIRPNDSEIFSAVVHQNTSKVREILAAGDASVLDVNEEGESLLTVSSFVTSMACD